MAEPLEFLSPSDKPALLAISQPDLLASARSVLEDLGYKVHAAADHADFTNRFTQVQYQVVILEESFAAATPEENEALRYLQELPMGQRRHATSFLISDSRKSLDPMHAFNQSVHAIINRADLEALGQIILKIVSDNDLFLRIYRDTQQRLSQGK